jgi:hypothetical protein
MSYITVRKENLGSVTLPSNAHEHFGSMSVKTTNPLSTSRHRKFPLAMLALLVAAFEFNSAARAQDVAPPSRMPWDRFSLSGIIRSQSRQNPGLFTSTSHSLSQRIR